MQPLIKADDVIGLALSYFLDGQLKESFQGMTIAIFYEINPIVLQ